MSRRSFLSSSVAFATGLLSVASAQQYAGDTITNSMTTVPGAELAYFRVADPAGVNNNLTLINYYSLQTNGSRVNPEEIQRAVIVIHGDGEDPETYISEMISALADVTTDDNINRSSVAMIAPYFVNGDYKNVAYPFNSTAGGSTSNALVWRGSQWSAGANNQYPKNAKTVSSFYALDSLIKYFDDLDTFPLMQHIVVAGHSLGAQTVHRYAEIGNEFDTNSSVTYYIGNPDSYTWLTTDRPISSYEELCPTYDNYRDGYTNFTQYPMTYGSALVSAGRTSILARYNSRSKAYARGTLDFGDDASECGAYTTGTNRNERFFNFIKSFPAGCASISGQCDTIDYVDAGHDAGAMFSSDAGLARIFIDHFYGNDSMAYDFGYPRLQAGDDPYPNPEYSNDTITVIDEDISANGFTYQGCYSDEFTGVDSLANLVYSNDNNTIELCTATCLADGYTIAGMEYGTNCWCGNTLSYYADKTVEEGCVTACPGNSSEICGDNYRLSLYSYGTLDQDAEPVFPAKVGKYAFYDCMTDSTSDRTLSAANYAGTDVDLEYCATFCAEYDYFGVEYADECYCGNALGSSSTVGNLTDCYMVCDANHTELCGGPNRLTVYLKDDYSSSSSSSSSSVASSTSTKSATSSTSTTSATSSTSTKSAASSTSTTSATSSTSTTSATSSTSTKSATSSTSTKSATSSTSTSVTTISTHTSSTKTSISSSTSSKAAATASTKSASSASSSSSKASSASSKASSSSTKSSSASSKTSSSSRSSSATSSMKTITTSTSKSASTSSKSSSTSSTSAALSWHSTCTATCHAASTNCASFTSKVLSYCSSETTAHTATATTTKSVTATTTVTKTGKTATVTKTTSAAKRAAVTTSSSKKASTTTTKKSSSTSSATIKKDAASTSSSAITTCSSAPAILTGYNCSQVSALCACLETATSTKTATTTVATVTDDVWPSATKTVTVT